MNKHANYRILNPKAENEDPLLIEDIGPWDSFPTITNAAEFVVADLHRYGYLPIGRRLYCIDSEGKISELLIVGGLFYSFGDLVECKYCQKHLRKSELVGRPAPHACPECWSEKLDQERKAGNEGRAPDASENGEDAGTRHAAG